MTHTPTYQESYNKIIEAYFRDEIKPCDSNFCFCGTLSPTKGMWNINPNGAVAVFSWGNENKFASHVYDHPQPYTLAEYKRMEWALIKTKNSNWGETYEDDLFAGMSAALDVLKQIHIERGEVIDPTPSFTKRQLVNSK